MSFIKTSEKEINCKVVYCGPSFSGKSTSLRCIYEKISPNRRGSLPTLSEEKDGALFFDFLPLSLGKIKGYTVRFHLYTIPANPFYESPRKVLLKGVDGVVFVVDSQMDKLEENMESWKGLKKNLRQHGIDFETLPTALQYNKRDLSNALPVTELHEIFNRQNLPEFETIAKQGKNVMECFQVVAKQVLRKLK